MAAALDVRGVTVRFGDRAVLDRFDLSVPAGERVALLGPSGSGKSTLLRVVAGLLVPDTGRIEVGGVDVSGMPAHRRHVGMVFQDEQLFPHRTVAQNVAFGLRMQHVPRAEIAARVASLLDLVGLAGFGDRTVPTLSGGEAKRVALARALAPEPRVLLLDEPLTGLDRDLHDRLAVDLRDLLDGLGTTALHVTHDEGEALVVAQRVVRLGVRHSQRV
jgi:thiamine transport system ATP-binding protein